MNIILLSLVFFTPVVMYGIYDQTRRKSGLKKIARKMGFEYLASPDENEGLQILHNTIIFNGRFPTGTFQDFLSGRRKGYHCSVVDYYLSFDTGRGRAWEPQTIICIDLKSSKFIPFAIRHKSRLGLPNMPIGKKSIVEEKTKDIYLKHQILVANTALVDFIGIPESFMQFFVAFPELNAECFADRVIIYRPKVLIPPDQITKHLDNAIHLAVILDGNNKI
ncbi:MAG: hypothetical protein NVS3B3_05040 [Aquirhabdus sp.]